MKLFTTGRLAFVGMMASGTAIVATAQQTAGDNEPEAGFNDPVFWQLVEAGPATSDELEHVVTTYAANGMSDEVTRAFADYLLRSDPESEVFCGYCSALLSDADAPQGNDTLLGALRDAMEIAADDAFQRGASDRLVRLAVITGVSGHRKHQDHALYFLVMASQLGIEDAWRDDVAVVLAQVGLYADALKIANSLYENPGSAHFQSADLRPWITYLNDVIERNRHVRSIITAATG